MALQELPQRNLHQFILWKVAPSTKACSTRPRVVADLAKSARMHIVRLMNNLVKQKCSSHVEEEWSARKRMATCCHPWQKSREIGETRYQSWHLSWVETRTCWTSIIERTTIGLCLSRHEAAEAYLTEEHRHAETNPTCEIHESYCTSHWNSRPKSPRSDIFAQVNLISVAPTLHKFWGSVSGGYRVSRARCPRSSVEVGQKCVEIKGARKSNILVTFGK